MYNEAKLCEFHSVYQAKLQADMNKHPDQYAGHNAELVSNRMIEAIKTGGVGGVFLSNPMKAAARELNISPTKKGLDAYLRDN